MESFLTERIDQDLNNYCLTNATFFAERLVAAFPKEVRLGSLVASRSRLAGHGDQICWYNTPYFPVTPDLSQVFSVRYSDAFLVQSFALTAAAGVGHQNIVLPF